MEEVELATDNTTLQISRFKTQHAHASAATKEKYFHEVSKNKQEFLIRLRLEFSFSSVCIMKNLKNCVGDAAAREVAILFIGERYPTNKKIF